MRRDSEQREQQDGGFTLVEMMVTLIVIAVLVAIAVPTFLRARERTDERAAQVRAHTGIKAAKVAAADNQDTADDAGELAVRLGKVEPSIQFAEDVSAENRVKGIVYVRLESGSVATLVSQATNGKCFWTKDVNGQTYFAEVACADEPPAEGSLEWKARW